MPHSGRGDRQQLEDFLAGLAKVKTLADVRVVAQSLLDDMRGQDDNT